MILLSLETSMLKDTESWREKKIENSKPSEPMARVVVYTFSPQQKFLHIIPMGISISRACSFNAISISQAYPLNAIQFNLASLSLECNSIQSRELVPWMQFNSISQACPLNAISISQACPLNATCPLNAISISRVCPLNAISILQDCPFNVISILQYCPLNAISILQFCPFKLLCKSSKVLICQSGQLLILFPGWLIQAVCVWDAWPLCPSSILCACLFVIHYPPRRLSTWLAPLTTMLMSSCFTFLFSCVSLINS